MIKTHISTTEINALGSLGLDEKQAKVYLTALSSGGGSVTELAKLAEMERTGLYYYLEALIDLGLIRESTVGKRTTYLASDPARLQDLLSAKSAQLKIVLPKLESAFASQAGKSRFTHYQGKEGIISLYEEILKLMSEMKEADGPALIFSRPEILDALPEYYPKLIKRRMQLPLKIRGILPKSIKTRQKIDITNFKDFLRHAEQIEDRRYLDDEFFPDTIVLILKDSVATIDYKTFFGTLTENKNLATTWRKFFNFIWEQLG